MFRRRRRVEEALDDDETTEGSEASGDDESESESEPPPLVRPQGPWDVDDAPDDEVQRLDLGGMRVPVLPELEVRVEVTPQGQVAAATLVTNRSALQVNVFAAPRTEGIWAEVRAEIVDSLASGPGTATEADGPFGPELRAQVPTEVPGQGLGLQAARFVGVDGPRWFLRGLFTGAAAVDPQAAAPLEAALRSVVVVRGAEAMAARDPLPLRLPPEVTQPAPDPTAGADGAPTGGGPPGPDGPDPDAGDDTARPSSQPRSADDLSPFVRGPEITETR